MTQYITSPKGQRITVDEFYAMTGVQQYHFLGRTEKWRKAQAQHNANQKRPIMTDKGIFNGPKAVMEAYGYKDKNSVYHKIISVDPKYRNWYYVEDGVKKVDKNFVTGGQKRHKTMITKYGKRSLTPAVYTFDGLSQKDFMIKNKKLIISLIDPTHKYKYHKLHQLLIDRADGKIPSPNRRSQVIVRFLEEIGKKPTKSGVKWLKNNHLTDHKSVLL
tara:strand:- start:717 stop:1367 length:651 start_codon:yes stop_codon:yes gene_type:complete